MFVSYYKLAAVSLLPVLCSVLFYLWSRAESFQRLSYACRQILIGLVFGALAIVGNEYSIPIDGAQVNCRDAAVLCAGLLFGGPAGILAGVIGGLERWFCVYWGGGMYTRLACSLSTALAGFYAAALRKFMFDEKKPGWLLSGLIGIVMEVFHLTMIFLTNLHDAEHAASVVKICTAPMILANSISLLLATVLVSLLSGESLFAKKTQVGISQTIQRYLLICVVLTFLLTSSLVLGLQNNMAYAQTESLLRLSLEDMQGSLRDASDQNLLDITKKIAVQVPYGDLTFIAENADVAEIDIIDRNGIIVQSTNADFVGFDLSTGEQSAEFLCLLDGSTTEFVQEYGPISIDSSISRKYAAVATEDGFVQVGYDAEQFQADLSKRIVDATAFRHVGENGFLLVSDAERNIVSGPDSMVGHSLSEFIDLTAYARSEEDAGEVFRVNFNGEDSFAMYALTEGYTLLSVLSTSEAYSIRNVAVFVNSYMEILTFAVQFALIYLLIKKVVVNRIHSINDSLSKITGGDLNVTVNVRENAEFASLSDDINSTVDTLKRYIDEAAARIDAELEFAKSIQTSSLPSTFPAFPDRDEFEIFAAMDTAKEVGGDFYDFYLIGENKLCFLIADVSGKGIPAALFMMRAKTELKRLAETGAPLNEVVEKANNDLCLGNDAGMFVTAWMGILDLETGHVSFVNAGHNPPLVNYAGCGYEFLRSRAGLVLGGMAELPYRMMSMQLNPGDTLFLYTDGVTEATNASQELFGDARLDEALEDAPQESMEGICRSVKAAVDTFVGEAPQFDDITMLALRYWGKQYPTLHYDEAALTDIPAVTEFVEQELEKLDCPLNVVTKFAVSIDEIYSNIVFYAYEGGKGPVTVQIQSRKNPRSVTLVFEDEGVPYNPLAKQDPDITLSAEERGIGGLGILIVKKFMDDVSYEYKKDKNRLSLTKNF